MIDTHSVLSFASSGMLILLAVSCIARRIAPQTVLLALSALLLAGVQFFQGLLLLSSSPAPALLYFRIMLVFAILLPAAALPFFVIFARVEAGRILREGSAGIIVLAVLLAAAAVLLRTGYIVSRIHIMEGGNFWGITFTAYGKILGICLLVSNVFYAYSFENIYRSANVAGKVTLKYPLLGMIAASVINFIVISRQLALSTIDRNFFALQSCGLLFLAVTLLYASSRYRLFALRISPRRGSSPSVITVIVAGLYLLTIALISYISILADIPYDRFSLLILGVFAAFMILAIIISGKARRRLRRFMNDNFYLDRYHYRKEWRHYAGLMASSLTIEDFLANTISSLCESVMVRRGFIYIDVMGGKRALFGIRDDDIDPGVISGMMELCRGPQVLLIKKPRFKKHSPGEKDRQSISPAEHEWIRSIVFLRHGDECRGLIALGEKDMDTPFTGEDTDFLETIADQAMLTLDNLLMEERILESRQMESFNRFASFVIHDLKNTVGMLSLTAENAKLNINNAEFQADAIQTINRSVQKMQDLIDSLNAHKPPASISRSDTEINSLIGRSLSSMKDAAEGKGIELAFSGGGEIFSFVDPSAITRIIENLVLNAIDATGRGGRVELAAGVDGDGSLKISVTDNGNGFDPVYYEDHLFKPFSSTKKNGLGIGLVLCKSLVEAHGGAIMVESEPGKGSRVSIRIPPAGPSQ